MGANSLKSSEGMCNKANNLPTALHDAPHFLIYLSVNLWEVFVPNYALYSEVNETGLLKYVSGRYAIPQVFTSTLELAVHVLYACQPSSPHLDLLDWDGNRNQGRAEDKQMVPVAL